MKDFNADLNKVLKYGADQSTVEDLIRTLAENPEHQHTPDSAHRLVTADALDEVGRHDEAKWLRQRRPVAVRDGRIIPQYYTRYHVRGAERELTNLINRATDWMFNWENIPSTVWHHNAPPGIANPSTEELNTHHFSSMGHRHGMLESFDRHLPSYADDPNAEVFHIRQYPEWLAQQYEKALTDGGHWQNMEPDDGMNVRDHIDDLRRSPVTADDQYGHESDY